VIAGNPEQSTVTAGESELSAVMAGSVIALEKGDTCGELYGICMDIGTTTVVVSLIHLADGAELATASRVNAQKELGLDVLSRISREMEDPDNGKKQLQSAIVQSVNEMIQEVCEKSGVKSCNIYEITVAANCTMMHMFLGIDARPIGKSPYSPIFTEAQTVSAEKIGLKAADCAEIYCLPSVSAYIGADIVAGAYVCQLQHAKDRVLFIDIGTNGEIVLSDGGRLLCCSCAAGPALEGMNISCGMRAAEGAIEDVQITETGVKLSVIGDEARAENADVGNSLCPEGICGSGILAVVKELVRTGLVRKDGAFIKKEKLPEDDYRYPMLRMNGRKREFILTNQGGQEDVQNIQNPDARLSAGQPLFITQGDIRQVQLAKGAILSGFKALLKKAGISMEELDRILIAGQFGAHLPAESLTGTGILPKEVQDKLNYVGNSSKTGAYMALMSREVRSEMEKLAEQMEYMELGNTEGYERLFAECMMFPERSQANHPSDFF
ncbi:MAG: ASKHA domain-containing protein, partial [Lachnospiraceae bacterium]|nr:ASKHA domain-containing protein [Lachnospiraceae bacterium]